MQRWITFITDGIKCVTYNSEVIGNIYESSQNFIEIIIFTS